MTAETVLASDGTPIVECQVTPDCQWRFIHLAQQDPALMPLLQTFIAHHFAEAHPKWLTDTEGQDPAAVLAECAEVFEAFGIDPDNPYDQLEPDTF